MAESEREWLPLDLIKTTADYLQKKGIPTPRLDAEVLLCSVLDCTRVKLYTIYDEFLTEEELTEYRDMIRRRIAREPVSRILGKREFMGLDFVVTPDVLSPRPDTEILVEKAIQLLDDSPKEKRSDKFYKEWDRKNIRLLKEQVAQLKEEDIPPDVAEAIREYEKENGATESVDSTSGGRDKPRLLLDLGTGTGCIPISIVKHVKNVLAVGVDISVEALGVARMNAESLEAADKVEFIESNFFDALDPERKFDIIVSNPPYLIEGDQEIWPEVSKYDPALALYATDNGLACYKAIIGNVKEYLVVGGVLLLEIGAGQRDDVSDIVRHYYPHANIVSLADYSGIDRVLVVNDIVN